MDRKSPHQSCLHFEYLESRMLLAGDIGGLYGHAATLAADINVSSAETRIRSSIAFQDNLFFLMDDDTGDTELWKTDGGAAGTTRVAEIYTNQSTLHRDVYDTAIAVVGDTLYFQLNIVSDLIGLKYARSGAAFGEAELWKSDGTESGTQHVADLGPWSIFGMNTISTRLMDHDQQLLMTIDEHTDSTNRSAFWTSDGTQAGTTIASPYFDMAIWPAIQEPVPLNGDWYFIGGDVGLNPSFGLWKTNPTIGVTELVRDFFGSWETVIPQHPVSLIESNGQLFFWAVGDDPGQYELWKSDGTPEGTAVVAKPAISSGFDPPGLVAIDGDMYFTDQRTAQLWKSDGTESGTIIVKDGFTSGTLVNRHDNLPFLFERFSHELWRVTDGSIDLVKTFDGSITDVELFSDTVFVRERRGLDESVLWISNGPEDSPRVLGTGLNVLGTVDSTVILTDNRNLFTVDTSVATTEQFFTLMSATNSLSPFELVPSEDGLFYFSESDGELRRTLDGTSGTTEVIQGPSHVMYGPAGEPRRTTKADILGDSMYIFGKSGLTRINTSTGAQDLLKSTTPDKPPLGTNIDTVSSDDTVYFIRAFEQQSTFLPLNQLWKTDGTDRGTTLVYESADHGLREDPQIEYVNDNVYFLMAEKTPFGRSPWELWRSNGSTAGTSRMNIKDVLAIEAFGEELFILQHRPDSLALWRTDGDDAELVKSVKTVQTGFGCHIQSTSNAIYFADGDGGLWRSDGTEAGTTLVKSFPTTFSPEFNCRRTDSVSNLAPWGTNLFFTVDDGEHGNELWITDGTELGTVLAADIRPGSKPSLPADLTFWNDQLFFSANDGEHGRELWQIDLMATDTSHAGDIDENGEVNFQDFLLLAQNFGKATDLGHAAGDLNENGKVDFLDFLALAQNFGRTIARSLVNFQ